MLNKYLEWIKEVPKFEEFHVRATNWRNISIGTIEKKLMIPVIKNLHWGNNNQDLQIDNSGAKMVSYYIVKVFFNTNLTSNENYTFKLNQEQHDTFKRKLNLYRFEFLDLQFHSAKEDVLYQRYSHICKYIKKIANDNYV